LFTANSAWPDAPLGLDAGHLDRRAGPLLFSGDAPAHRVGRAGLGNRRKLTLTAAGQQTLAAGRVQAEHISRRLLTPLPADEQAQPLCLLRKLRAGLAGTARTPVVPPGSKSAGK